MNKFFTSNRPITNVFKNANSNSEVVTQLIYGDQFSIKKETKNWFKIKISHDGYQGFIKKRNYQNYVKPTHKISVISAKIYKKPNTFQHVSELTFGSKIKINKKGKKFSKYENRWVENKNFKPIKYVNTNIFNKIKIFENTKYKWGGKSFKGIDCSALVQVFFNFNNKYCPRDAKDQIRFFKKNISLKNLKKNDIIFWKGHVAVSISKKKLLHAYGPSKKTLVMNIKHAIQLIDKTANLKVLKIKRI